MDLKVTATGARNYLFKRCAGPFWMRRRWLRKTELLSESELRALQLRLLQDLVKHCYLTVPYYREIMDRLGIKPDDIRGLEDIKRFPILTREDVVAAGDRIVSRKYPKFLLQTANTSGTTGSPLRIRRDLFAIENEHAFLRRQWEWAGLGLRDRVAYLKGMVIVKPGEQEPKLYGYDPFMCELHLSTYHLSTKTAKQYIEVMKRYHVQGIYGYPSSILPIAKTCLDAGIDLKLRSVLVTSETLLDSQRKTLANAFGATVHDHYGAAERVIYVFTCEKGSYHIIPEYGLTELLPVEGGPDGSHQVIATGFWNRTMPLLRYDTRDQLIPSAEKCACGRAFPVIDKVLGREGDMIRTPGGAILGPSILTALVYVVCAADHWVESQIVQDALDHVWIYYVPRPSCTPDYVDNLGDHIRSYLPKDLRLDMREVDAVQRTAAGKLKAVVSLLGKSNSPSG